MAHLPGATSVLSLVGIFATGYGGAQVINWALHRRSERATMQAASAQADAAESQADLNRVDLLDRLSTRLERQDRTIEELRQRIEELQQSGDERDAAHQRELAQRDQKIGTLTMLNEQQAVEIQGLKEQLALLRSVVTEWQVAAKEGRDALREMALKAVSPPAPDGDGE